MLNNVQFTRGNRRPQALHIVVAAFLLFFLLTFFVGRTERHGNTTHELQVPSGEPARIAPETLKGQVVMPKLGNETAKAELGRAAWKLFHTTMARFPDEPTAEESEALKSYIWLFARLYPCGECAAHFQKILSKYPPQTTSRSTAAGWACFVHNEVNKSKKKPLFDCNNIGDFYDCGCAEDEDASKKGLKNGKKTAEKTIQAHDSEPVEITKNGETLG